MSHKEIPIFFSCDDGYVPCMAVALKSLEDNASREYNYTITVLHSNTISQENQKKITDEFNKDIFSVSFTDITEYVANIDQKLHTRDYYTKSTYYRLFIPHLFPQYDKVLYLDTDILITGDISKLYHHDIGENLVGAVVEDVMVNFDVFGTYVEKALGINRERYFNAGILLMNARLFREEDVVEKFFDLLFSFYFYVTQDEDYLNVLCKERVLFIDDSWNKAPIPGTIVDEKALNLIHYKMNWKPWKYENVGYGSIFWSYAYQTDYFACLMDITRKNIDPEVYAKDKVEYENLVAYAIKDSCDPNNYHQTQIKNKGLR